MDRNLRTKIIPATEQDLEALVNIEEAVSMQKYPSAELGITLADIAAIGWGKTRVAKYKKRFLENPNASIWVAKENDIVVGFTAAIKEPDSHRIWKLYIAGGHQNKGIGRKLLTQAEAWLGNKQDIWLGIASYDDASLRFYTKRGYRPVGTRPQEQTTVHATGKVIPETVLVKTHKI